MYGGIARARRLAALCTVAAAACLASAGAAPAHLDEQGSALPAQVALTWNSYAVDAVRAARTLDGQPAGAAARPFYQGEGLVYLAYVQAAVYDAVTKIAHRYEPYHHFTVGAGDASAEAAVVAAAYDTLTFYLGDPTNALAVKYAASIAALPDDRQTARGIAVGEAAASDLEALRAGDGRNAATDVFGAIGPVVAGAWQVVPPQVVAQTPWLGFMRPFLLESPAQFRSPPPEASTSDAYTADFNRTATEGASTTLFRTADQTKIAIFWNGNVINQDNQAYRDVSVQHGLDLVDTVHLLAMGELMEADAIIACSESKYHYLAWRPYTAIRNADLDGNPATTAIPGWTPLLPTPNHPEYPSAHGCLTGTLTRVIGTITGSDAIDLTLSGASAIGGPNNTTRHYATARDLDSELLDARVWGGLHWYSSDVAGEALGNAVSDWALARYFLPLDD